MQTCLNFHQNFHQNFDQGDCPCNRHGGQQSAPRDEPAQAPQASCTARFGALAASAVLSLALFNALASYGLLQPAPEPVQLLALNSTPAR